MKTILKIKIISAITFIFLLGFLSVFFIEYKFGKKIVHIDLDIDSISEDCEETKYKFLETQYANYIIKLADELKIDSDLVVAILMVENPEFDPVVTHRNDNGTNDLGLFQINDRYCYSVFVKAYWDMDIDFNPYNWKHNTFLAMHHIEYLLRTLKVQDDAIMAYNCGMGSVMNNQIPDSTRKYLARVKNNLKLIKNMKETTK